MERCAALRATPGGGPQSERRLDRLHLRGRLHRGSSAVEGDEPQHDGRRSDERSTARHRTRLSGTHHRSRALRDVPCKVADEDRGDAGRVPRVLAAEGMDESGADPHNRDHRDARGQHGRWWCRPYRWNRLRGGTWHLRGRCEYRWRSHMEVGDSELTEVGPHVGSVDPRLDPAPQWIVPDRGPCGGRRRHPARLEPGTYPPGTLGRLSLDHAARKLADVVATDSLSLDRREV